MTHWSERLRRAMFRPVDPASLVFFRIAFGLIMIIEVWRYLSKGWIPRYYIRPEFHFKYDGFGWVEPWAGNGMYWHFLALGLLAACIMVGAFYRVATVLFFIGFSYVFLLDQAQYLNHFYLVILIAFLMCFVPAHRAFSIDAWRSAKIRASSIPAWAIWLLVIQFEIMLLYAGIVKVNPDWLRLEPLGTWLNQRDDLPFIGQYFSQPWVVAFGAYGVIALHLIGAPLLLWRRTRLVVFVLYCMFHLSNHVVFTIGIFPWFTIVGTLMFFDPDWPRQIARQLLRPLSRLAGVDPPDPSSIKQLAPVPERPDYRLIAGLMAVWFAVQIGAPLRHHLYPGNVAWNEDGHRFSWRMKLRDKEARARFTVRDLRTNRRWRIDPTDYLSSRQARKMRNRPDMILQFAYLLEERFMAEQELTDVAVYADVRVSLNGRPLVRFFDSTLDLTTVSLDALHSTWLLPLTEPLPAERDWAEW